MYSLSESSIGAITPLSSESIKPELLPLVLSSVSERFRYKIWEEGHMCTYGRRAKRKW